MKVIIIFV